jgi:hypothetical protein
MFYEFPSMPGHDPEMPEHGGSPAVRLAQDSLILDFGGDKFVEIPFRAIRRKSIVLRPGCDTELNSVTIEILAAHMSVDGDSRAASEVLVQPHPVSVEEATQHQKYRYGGAVVTVNPSDRIA